MSFFLIFYKYATKIRTDFGNSNLGADPVFKYIVCRQLITTHYVATNKIIH